MAHRVSSSMDFYKFCLIAFLILNKGFPIRGVPESHSDGSKSPSAKECRAHIEAALEQYWEASDGDNKDGEAAPDSTPSSTQPSESLLRETEGPQSEDETEQDDDDIDPPVDVQSQDEDQEGEDDNDDDDDEEDDDDDDEEDDDSKSDKDSDEQKQTPDSGLDSDDEDDEDDEDEAADERVSPNTEPDNGTDADDDEDDDDDDDDEDEEEDDEDDEEYLEEKAGALKGTEDETEEDEDEEDEEADDTEDESTEEISQQEDDKKTDTGDKDKDLSGEQKDEDEDEDEEEDEEEEEEADEEEEEEKEDADEEEEEKEEEDEEEEEEGDEEDDEEEEDVDEAGYYEKDKSAQDDDTVSGTLQKDARDDKVTGETHSAPVGMAPELSEAEPTSDQPEASPDEEKAALESQPEETEEEDEEKEVDEGEEETAEHREDDDLIENIYEEEDEEDVIVKPGETLRSRDHVDAILGLDDIGTDYDMEEEKLAQSVFREIKKIHATNIRPMEMLYKYADSTTRLLGDAEIFSKPMVLFLGPWSSGKTTIINYLLGLERTPEALKTGTGITDLDFTVLDYGEQRRTTSGTALAADWRYAGVQKFGQGLLDHFKRVTIPHTLLKKITIVDTPGIIESQKNTERGYPFNDAFQWFIDRADAIYVVLDPTKVDIGAELGSVLDQLKGREVRFVLNKADSIRRSDLMRVVGQLFWNLSPLMSSTEAPVIYAVSLTTKPFHPSAPARFLADQENNFLYDLRDTIDKHVENRIRFARSHAVRVRNHCKMVDCYLSTYYRHKSIFSSKKNVAKLITENPVEYSIYDGLSSMTNVSRYDLPDPVAYKNFFKMHALYDFKPLVSTCSYFRGCPMDKLDLAISSELPELLAKYKKAKLDIPVPVKQEGR